jgi:hypothetical protein
MTRVFFHIRSDDDFIADEEGEPCGDLNAARYEAERSLRHMLADDLRQDRPARTRCIEVTDAEQRLLARVTLLADVRVLREG